MSREAMEMALEALEEANQTMSFEYSQEDYYSEAITALRQALEEKQEPVAWMYTSQWEGNERFITTYQSELTTYKADKVWPLYTAPPKRELTCVCGAVWEGETMVHSPREREWVGLTAEEIAQGPQEVLPALYGRWGWAEKEAFEAVVAWAEAKLKEKNT